MEPLKALTFVVAAGVASLVGIGAVGFYAGYSAGRGNLDEIKAQLASAPAAIATSEGAVSLKPITDDIRALSKQVEALAAVRTPQPQAAASGGDNAEHSKAIIDELKALSRQVESLRGQQSVAAAAEKTPAAPDYTDALQDIRDQIKALNVKLDRQDQKAPKPLVDEIRSLSASIQAQEPLVRRAISDEVRSAVAILQNSEPKVSKALMDEVRVISANVRAPESRSQVSVADQIKVLTAAVEALKAKLSDEGREVGLSADVEQIRQLVTSASEQFRRCQTQFASAAPGVPAAPQPQNGVLVSQTSRTEPSAFVFYDNVMLKKDQEKAYDEIGIRLALQSVAPRQVRLAINRQGVGLAFGERKVFRSQDVECELNLMETNLNDGQARLSISCKR